MPDGLVCFIVPSLRGGSRAYAPQTALLRSPESVLLRVISAPPFARIDACRKGLNASDTAHITPQ
jgi:hypothetical protein